jgi:hypothetical protein
MSADVKYPDIAVQPSIINRKNAVKAGLVARLGALAAAPVIATAKAARYRSRYGDDYSISCSSDYYWRRWQLPRRNGLLQRLLLLQQWLGRLLNIGAATPRHKARKAHAWEGEHIARTVYAASEDDARQTHPENSAGDTHRGGSPMNHPCSENTP